jgi:hypothetical protein
MVTATSPPAGFEDEEAQLTEAVRAAAGDLRASGPLPRRSEDVLRFAVRDRLLDAGLSDIAQERSSITGGWTPIPGRLDLYTPARRSHRWAAEFKVWDVDQQIWDALKLATGIAHGDLRIGYLLAAAPPTAFAQYDGAELFAAGRHQQLVRDLLDRNAGAWQKLLNGGSARPIQVPLTLYTSLLLDEWCWFGHRARLVRVEIETGRSVPTVRFKAGWPEDLDEQAALTAATARARRPTDDALGLAVPRWSDTWWASQLRHGVSRDQFEALYGLLLTRNWSDAEIRARVQAPVGFAPPWWTGRG